MCYRQGWECPRCRRINSPDRLECVCPSINIPSVWTDWEYHPPITTTNINTNDFIYTGETLVRVFIDGKEL